MKLTRTTLRLRPDLKKTAEKLAKQQNTTLQALFNKALELYLGQIASQKTKQILFHAHDLGVPLDNLTRDDIYPDPEIPS